MDRNPEQDRRLLWAFVLTMAVMFLWQKFFLPKPPPAEPAAVTAEAPSATPTAASTAAPATPAVAEQVIPRREVSVQAPGWIGKLSSTGGAINQVTLNDYQTEPTVTPIWIWVWDKVRGEADGGWVPYQGGGTPAVLLDHETALGIAGVGAPGVDVDYLIEEAGGATVAHRVLPGGVEITKRYTPGDKPGQMLLEVSFKNSGPTPVDGVWVGVSQYAHKKASRFDNAVMPVGYADGDLHTLEEPSDVLGSAAKVTEEGPVQWFGLANRYFLSVLLPETPADLRLVFDDLGNDHTGAFAVDGRALNPGETRTLKFSTYLGPKDLGILEQTGQDLDDAVEFGFFGFFSKILLFLLEVFQKGVVSWGLSIILLTVLVKALFYPLTQKSYVSGRRMQQLQPQMNELKEKYKDDPTKQQQEMMKLFSANDVNPLGGCLPTLVQMPIWFGLYSCLSYSVELYNSRFLYLQDLTAADPYAVLPTVVAVLFYAQQAMTPMTGMDPAQQKMMKAMPIVFAVFMYSLPSGLALYITVNSVLSIAQMWLIKRTMPAPQAA